MFPAATTKKVSRFQFHVADLDSFNGDSVRNTFTLPSRSVPTFVLVRLVNFGALGVGQSSRRNSANGCPAEHLH